MPRSNTRLSLHRPSSPLLQLDSKTVDSITRQVDALELTLPEQAMEEVQKKNQAVNLTDGSHGGFLLNAPDTFVRALGGGSIVDRPCTIKKAARIDGVYFLGSGEDQPLMTIKGGADTKVIITNCRFELATTGTAPHIRVENGPKVHFIGCIFDGGDALHNVVEHAGVAGNIQITNYFNRSPRPLGINTSGGSGTYHPVLVTTAYTAFAWELVEADARGGAFTVSLPATPAQGDALIINKVDATGNTVTVSGNGTNINGGGTFPLPFQYDSLTVVRGSTQWWIV